MKKKRIDMKCEVCGKNVEPTKKTVIKQIKYPKGHIQTDRCCGTLVLGESYGFLGLKSRNYKRYNIETLQATEDIYETYFICPICDNKNILSHATGPSRLSFCWRLIDTKEHREDIYD
jgi:transcription elongation factor Elf1